LPLRVWSVDWVVDFSDHRLKLRPHGGFGGQVHVEGMAFVPICRMASAERQRASGDSLSNPLSQTRSGLP
jgi:hypothetical protein